MTTTTKPIGAGLWARLLTLLFVKAIGRPWLRRICKASPGLVTVFGLCIKVKPYPHLGEAYAMRFVAQHTSIPVPKVYCAFVYSGWSYVVMSRIPGEMACLGWQRRSAESKERVLSQLRRMVTELRSVRLPEDISGVAGVDGGCFSDCRLPTKTIWDSFPTTRSFHQALANGIKFDVEYKSLASDMSELFEFYRGYGEQVVLTHGDLSSLNILVRQDDVNTFWADEVDHFLTPMPHEFEMDTIRRKYFGDFR
ncbi:hypothetical protein HIM_09589 [Hirsutella minnesotensis 3608]|uniref:Aminoglycoside phosphotransferase domain-containing protein n=1 Tax=Hirsutella minnesotensis 3608 TaxID=1043627 RepID=A0A0F7ZL93_9HYPO|nr:hypothetical protein HIM_09589 [Hirsutella minnesotensis 3608]